MMFRENKELRDGIRRALLFTFLMVLIWVAFKVFL